MVSEKDSKMFRHVDQMADLGNRVRAISLLAVAVGDKGGAVEVSKAISLAIRNSFVGTTGRIAGILQPY